MMTFTAIFVVLFTIVATLVARRNFRLLLVVGIVALIFAGIGFALPFSLPADFFVRHPSLMDTPLHPWRSAFYGGVSFVFASSILLGLALRAVIRHCLRPNTNDNVV